MTKQSTAVKIVGGLVAVVLMAGFAASRPGANADKHADIALAMTTKSAAVREKMLVKLIEGAKETHSIDDSLFSMESTNCDCSGFDAVSLFGHRDVHIFQIVDNYYIHYGTERYTPDSYVSLLVTLRYPNEHLRFVIV